MERRSHGRSRKNTIRPSLPTNLQNKIRIWEPSHSWSSKTTVSSTKVTPIITPKTQSQIRFRLQKALYLPRLEKPFRKGKSKVWIKKYPIFFQLLTKVNQQQ